jgi:hypothetical protein
LGVSNSWLGDAKRLLARRSSCMFPAGTTRSGGKGTNWSRPIASSPCEGDNSGGRSNKAGRVLKIAAPPPAISSFGLIDLSDSFDEVAWTCGILHIYHLYAGFRRQQSSVDEEILVALRQLLGRALPVTTAGGDGISALEVESREILCQESISVTGSVHAMIEVEVDFRSETFLDSHHVIDACKSRQYSAVPCPFLLFDPPLRDTTLLFRLISHIFSLQPSLFDHLRRELSNPQ